MFARSGKRVVEWADCDPPGIVFRPRYFAMFDTATELRAPLTRRAIDQGS
jgi:acyl-CoA thioesterase FadM